MDPVSVMSLGDGAGRAGGGGGGGGVDLANNNNSSNATSQNTFARMFSPRQRPVSHMFSPAELEPHLYPNRKAKDHESIDKKARDKILQHPETLGRNRSYSNFDGKAEDEPSAGLKKSSKAGTVGKTQLSRSMRLLGDFSKSAMSALPLTPRAATEKTKENGLEKLRNNLTAQRSKRNVLLSFSPTEESYMEKAKRKDGKPDANADDNNKDGDEPQPPRRAKSLGNLNEVRKKPQTTDKVKRNQSDSENEEWEIIKEDFVLPSKGVVTGDVFGLSLEEVVALQETSFESELPLVLVSLVSGITKAGCDTEGIFRYLAFSLLHLMCDTPPLTNNTILFFSLNRISGNKTRVDALKDRIINGDYGFDEHHPDVHDMSTLLKEWLQALKEPVIPASL